MASVKLLFLGIAGFFVVFALPTFAMESVKLPYPSGMRFLVTTGYETPPTHIKKDAFALDFAQEGCRAYGVSVVAALGGTAFLVAENGYNGGYGAQVLVRSPGGVMARYAHLLAGSSPIRQGDEIPQGAVIGAIGNTGMVAGAACAEHPGTHLHFAIYQEQADGSFAPRDPEPISGYTGMAAGAWYLSNNAIAATGANLAALIALTKNFFGDAATVIAPTGTRPIPTPESSSTASPVDSGPGPGTSSSIDHEYLPMASSTEMQGSSSPSFLTPLPPPPASTTISESAPISHPSANGADLPPLVPATSSRVVPLGGGSSPGGVALTHDPSFDGGSAAGGVAVNDGDRGIVATDTPTSPDDPMDDTVAACVAGR